ncbi:unnamed protein product [Rhodiola kirilowii]
MPKSILERAMELAKALKENPLPHVGSYIKEYIDAHNNIGMLEMDLDNLEESRKMLTRGLQICDEEEVPDNDDARSRLHHNLGYVYTELRKWDKAREHIEKDIIICQKIGHYQGEAKGYINLGELHYRCQNIMNLLNRKKTVSEELCDKEKMADSYMLIGESYQKLRFFDKSLKWYLKSWEVYRSVRNLETSFRIKPVIDKCLIYNWLLQLERGHHFYYFHFILTIAVEASLPSVQLSALENMHYIQMIRLDNIDEARECQHAISKLKQLELKDQNGTTDICSETDTEGDNHALHVECEGNLSTRSNRSNTSGSQANLEPLDEDETLISIFHSARKSSRINVTHVENRCTSPKAAEALSVSLSKSSSSQQTTVGRKRVRVVLSDDEDEVHEESHKKLAEDIATSDEVRSVPVPDGPACTMKDVSGAASNCAMSSYTPGSLEENTSGCKFRSPMIGQHGKSLKSSSIELAEKRVVARESGRSDREEHIMCKIGDDIVQLEVRSLLTSNYLSTDSLKVEVACLYYLQLPVEKKSRGLLPIIRTLECDGRPLESLKMSSNSEDMVIRNCIEAFVEGWVHKPLMTLYVDNCKDLSEAPNIKLLKRLYDLEVSEDEVIATDCDLQDMSIKPLLKALHTLKTVSMIDLSHNMLGNGTMEALRQIFLSSGQAYGSLSMDLHCNRFGATALFQICECPVLFDRLEMLNLSGNRLTDACGSYLSTILEKCKALYSLNIERCSVTSRTIQKIADSLNSGSSLTHLSIGENSPISANVTAHLLEKLETLKRFSELSLKGIKLSKSVIDRLCRLIEVVCLSGLMLGSTNTGSDGALKLIEKLSSGTQELVKLDLSYCNLSSECIVQLNKNAELIGGIAELNLGGNAITLEGKNALTCLLMNPVCALKVLVLNNCQLGLTGLIKIIQTLEVNSSLEELSLAHNVDLQSQKANAFDMTYKDMTAIPSTDNFDDETKDNQHKEIDGIPQCSNAANVDYNDLEVADSEDESIRDKPPVSKVTLKCSSSSQSNRSSVNLNYIQELSSAISKAKNLKFLDLSNNGFSNQDVELLYSTWSVKGKVLRKEGDGKRIFSELAMTKMGGSSSSEASSGRHREEVEEPCRKSLAADVRGHDGMPLEVEKLQTEIIKTLCGVEQNKKTHCMCGVEQSNGIEGMEFQSLADLVRTHRPRVIGLIETKMASRSIYSRSHIDCVVEGVNQFRPSIFYGNQATHKRIESWELLKKLKSQTDLPWLASPGRFERGVVQLGIGAERRQGDLEAKARLDRAFKWLKEGDVNAKFFHERASQRNTVEKLKGEDGIWIKAGGLLLQHPELLISKVIKARYFPQSDLPSAASGNRPSWAWRSLHGGSHWLNIWFQPLLTPGSSLNWSLQEDRELIVKNIYSILLEKQQQDERSGIGETSDEGRLRAFWHKVWRIKAQEKVKALVKEISNPWYNFVMSRSESVKVWCPREPAGIVLVNCDGALDPVVGTAGFMFICRNNAGLLEFAGTNITACLSNVAEVEVTTMYLGMIEAEKHGISKAMFATDNVELLQMLQLGCNARIR